jgi:hypothetical protein
MQQLTTKMSFINIGPVLIGTCTRCGGCGLIQQQNMGGEVRHTRCSRCLNTGKEPQGRWERIKAAFRTEAVVV